MEQRFSLRSLIYAAFFCIASTSAWAQCSGVFPTQTICGNPTGSSAPPTVAPLSAFGGGTLGGNITRAQIPSTNTHSSPSLVLSGYSAANDMGFGAVYTCVGQSASSVLAIQDSVGTWCALAISKINQPLNIGWFGADPTAVTDSQPAIQAAIDAMTIGPNNGIKTVFCPDGNYKIGAPIFLDLAGNLRGADGVHGTAFDAGTTYGINATVNSAGIPYISLINSNTGNTPVSSPADWRPYNWNNATTYPINAIVRGPSGTPYISMANGNVGNNPTSDTAGVHWQPTIVNNFTANFGLSFTGNHQLGDGQNGFGCIMYYFPYQGTAFWLGPGQGLYAGNFRITNNNFGFYHGQLGNSIGICAAGDGGGLNRGLVENLEMDNFGIAYATGCNSDGLGAEVTWRKLFAQNCYIGVEIAASQNDINHVSDASFSCANSFVSHQGPGMIIDGASNPSINNGASNTFTVSGTSTLTLTPTHGSFNSYSFTTTIAGGNADSLITGCNSGTVGGSGPGCVYNSWMMLLPGWGPVPMQLTAFNSGTNQGTFTIWNPWTDLYFAQGNGATGTDFQTEIQAATRVWATERQTVFDGNAFFASGVHMENPGACTTWQHNETTLNADHGSHFTKSRFNYSVGLVNPENPPYTTSDMAPYLCQQSFPFIWNDNGASTILWEASQINGEGGDNVIIDITVNGGARCIQTGQGIPLQNSQVRLVPLATPTGGSSYSIQGGGCESDSNVYFPTNAAGGPPLYSGQGPYLGFRPAPWSTPRIQGADYTTLLNVAGQGLGSYPAVSGDTLYSILDNQNGGGNTSPAVGKFVQSAHIGFSYGQNLTTSNVSGLSWSYVGQSCFVAADQNTLNTVWPGLGITLNNGGGPVHYIVIGINRHLSLDGGTHPGYFIIYKPNWGVFGGNCGAGTSGTTFTGTAIGQDPYAWSTVSTVNNTGTPVLSTCGTSPVLAGGSNNIAGSFTTGTATPTACTLTFTPAYASNAFCTVSPVNAAAVGVTGGTRISAQSASAFTITLGTGTNSAQYQYTCSGS